MLDELSIRDFALIDRLNLRFSAGLNLLSGETGAGKSILIGALGFVLGGKADASVIRSGAEETLVSAVFSLDGSAEARAWMAERGIELEGDTVIIRRSLKENGRGSLYVQSAPVTRADLQALTACLIDIHGQHEHQSLLAQDSQRRILDRFAGIEAEVGEFTAAFTALSDKRNAFKSMLSSANDRSERVEMLEYALREIAEAKLREGEEEELQAEEKRLSQYEKLFEHIELVRESLGAHGEGALSRFRSARQGMEAAAGIDQGFADFSRRLDDAYFEIEDVAESFKAYVGSISFSPERLDEVQARLSDIFKLKKKHGASVALVLKKAEEYQAELDGLRTFEEDRGSLEAEIARLERDVLGRANQLSQKRQAAAAQLQGRVVQIIRTLGMPKADFVVSLGKKPEDNGKLVVGQYGLDLVEFLIAPNPGEPEKPLAKIASGGELSRVMLALKTALAETDSIGTMIFDEIDTGIGGEVALAVGEHLATLARNKQVFCVTHLASIAVRADNHSKVEKVEEGQRTLTKVFKIEGTERVTEIARMLSGGQGGQASIEHATELLKRFSPVRSEAWAR
jgi:DNA repair protein RecN (Recombination protein N)